MGRWLAALREHENAKTTQTGPDKTDKTSSLGVLSVLSVPSGSGSEKSGEGSVSFVSAPFAPFATSRVLDASALEQSELGDGLDAPAIPAAYRAAFETLRASCPTGVPEERWRQAVNDSARFLSEWGETASELGWSARDLFDLHETVPLSRVDRMGLVWLLKGERVILLTEAVARFERGLVYYRPPAGTRTAP